MNIQTLLKSHKKKRRLLVAGSKSPMGTIIYSEYSNNYA